MTATTEARPIPGTRAPADPMTRDQLLMWDLMHRAMRRHSRALERAIGQVRQDDVASARELADFWEQMCVQIVHHHTVEDTVFFPRLLAAAPESGELERLAEEHHALDAAMEDLRVQLRSFVRSGASAPARLLAVEAATAVAELLDGHLGREEDTVFPLFLTKVTASTYRALDEQAMASADKKALAFGAPWVLAYASPDETEQLYTSAPSIVKLMHKVFWSRSYAKAYPLMAA